MPDDGPDALDAFGHVRLAPLDPLDVGPLPAAAHRDEVCDAVTGAGSVVAPAAIAPIPTPSPVAADRTPATTIARVPRIRCTPLVPVMDRSAHRVSEVREGKNRSWAR